MTNYTLMTADRDTHFRSHHSFSDFIDRRCLACHCDVGLKCSCSSVAGRGSPLAPDMVKEPNDVRFGCAPWKGGVFQWVQAPLGDRSSRKQSEQSWR